MLEWLNKKYKDECEPRLKELDERYPAKARAEAATLLKKYRSEFETKPDELQKYQEAHRLISSYNDERTNIIASWQATLINVADLADATKELFAGVRNQKEFRAKYREVREYGIDKIVESHELHKESLTRQKMESLRSDVPEETFPGVVLNTIEVEEGNGTQFKQEYRMYTLKTAKQLEYEGHLPDGSERHCIGRDAQDYKRKITAGLGTAFSVRLGGVHGDIAYTLWYNRETQTVEQIKGPRNAVIQSLDNPAAKAVIEGLALLIKEKEKEFPIRRVDDLGHIQLSNGEFLVVEEGGVITKKKIDAIAKSDIIVSGAVKVTPNRFSGDYNLDALKKALAIPKCRIEFASLIFRGQPTFEYLLKSVDGGDDKFKAVMDLIVESRRKDLAENFLAAYETVSPYPADETLIQIMKQSQAPERVMTMAFPGKSSAFISNMRKFPASCKLFIEIVAELDAGQLPRLLLGRKFMAGYFFHMAGMPFTKEQLDVVRYTIEKILESGDKKTIRDFLFARMLRPFIPILSDHKLDDHGWNPEMQSIVDEFLPRFLAKLEFGELMRFQLYRFGKIRTHFPGFERERESRDYD